VSVSSGGEEDDATRRRESFTQIAERVWRVGKRAGLGAVGRRRATRRSMRVEGEGEREG